MSAANANIARHLGLMAVAQPEACALKVPRGRTRRGEIDYLALTFGELDAEVGAWHGRLARAGLQPGDRALVMVPPGLPLIASVFALFSLGAVPVVIDPGMGLKNFLTCVARSRPRVLVGVIFARLLSRICRDAFRSVGVRVAARGSLTARLTAPTPGAPATGPAALAMRPGDLAAILFTSGSTGAPKGVCYEHGMFAAQVRLIRDAYGITPGEVDLPLLPIFALFNPALGMTTIVPEIDPRRPAEVDPAKIVQAIRQENVTNSFGSPTLWQKIGEHCRAQNLTLPSLRRVLCAGAPVPATMWQSSSVFLPNGRLHSPYGATEALPVSTVSSEEIAGGAGAGAEPAKGACLGRPLPEIEVKVISITDAPIATLHEARELAGGDVGEIIVRGPVVTRTYDRLPEATALAKIPIASFTDPRPAAAAGRDSGAGEMAEAIPAPAVAVWHRMGDCGYVDASGCLWFCGRKAERVETAHGTMHTEPCERVFRQHPRAARCALLALGERPQQHPAIVVETTVKDSAEARHLARELRALGLQHEHTAAIKIFFFHPKFPVDVRHNAKIHRLALAKWVLTAKGYESDPKR